MRLIDADALMDKVDESQHENPHTLARDRAMHTHEHNHFLVMISQAPTIDAVPVVRCEDCKHFAHCEEVEGVSWTGFCNYGEFHTDEEDFCSRGERRSDD